MRANVAGALIAVLLTLSTSCGDDGTEESPDPLTDPRSTTTDADDPTGSTTTRPQGPLDPNDPDYPTIPPRPTVTYPSNG